MKEATAKVSSVRITPRKIGLLADEVRGKSVDFAFDYLSISPRRRTAKVLYDVLKSAVSNAERKGMLLGTLFVKTILVGQGKTLKRFRPRAKGSGFRINKKTSHVRVTLAKGW